MKIKKSDNVIVIAGKDKGKKGKVLKTLALKEKVVVEGVNIKKKHMRPRKSGQKGQIVDVAAPIHVSNVALIDPKTNKPTRVGMKIIAGKKIRVSKKSGVEV
jgi:large subunit ribosomal protein L24